MLVFEDMSTLGRNVLYFSFLNKQKNFYVTANNIFSD